MSVRGRAANGAPSATSCYVPTCTWNSLKRGNGVRADLARVLSALVCLPFVRFVGKRCRTSANAHILGFVTEGREAYLAREAKARINIARQLKTAGWIVQSIDHANVNAGRGVALREFVLEKGHGRVDYLLFVAGQPVGVIEAKPEGTTLVEVEHQSGKYVNGLVFSFHRPETLADWVLQIAADPQAPTFRARMRIMPVLDNPRLWEVQATAIRNLEESLRADRPRALIQMATGSCSPAYRPHGRALSASRHRNDLACTEASAADARDSDAAVPGARTASMA